MCSESDYNHRRQQVQEWIVDEWNAFFNIGSFLELVHSKRPPPNSSVRKFTKLNFSHRLALIWTKFLQRFSQLVGEASQKCESKFEMTATRSLASLFNPVKWLEESLKETCSFNCMLTELKIVSTFNFHTDQIDLNYFLFFSLQN